MVNIVKTGKPKRRGSFLFILITLIFVACSALAVIRVRSDIARRERELQELLVQCEEQRIENKEIERLFRLGDDEDYFERIARERLGWVHPNETVFFDVSGS